ncbi:hypothetical protein QA645_33645 [Bradyrhizobium sp. CIAT3101]|uniref:hypothetical protein n=1 Tax=Bradyrhizobium sp. CIAT3101 TaxID=439387 RepID=UPI0024B24DD1|nr:hypothetical protein [Bradyrhizobium sp. CIAT3101]WFU79401.1 hypothetical protein QA645_33645 [Bradyrhizobium sp. CIAT3101]
MNDTLKLKRGSNFPSQLAVGSVYEFSLDGRRVFNLAPSRVFLVEEIDGQWNYVGHVRILVQTIDAMTDKTSGRFEVVSLYPAEYVQLVNQHEAPKGRGYRPPISES